MGSLIGVGRFRHFAKREKMSKSLDEMWAEAKPWYEKNYKDPKTKKPIEFQSRPSDGDILFLFQQMNLFKKSVANYFDRGHQALQYIAAQDSRKQLDGDNGSIGH